MKNIHFSIKVKLRRQIKLGIQAKIKLSVKNKDDDVYSI